MNMTPLFQQMGVLMIVMCVGYLLFKLDIVDVHTKRRMTKVLLYVTSPCLIIDSFCDNVVSPEAESLSHIMPRVFLVAIGMFAFLTLVSWPLARIIRARRDQTGLYMMATVFGNIGFIGFPVITAVCTALWGAGTDSVGLFYGAIFCCIFNVLVYTLGMFLIRWGRDDHEESFWKALSPKKLLTPGVIACTAGVIVFALKIRLPGVVTSTLNSLGALTGTLAMLLVGANLAEMPARELVTDVKSIVYTLIRQFALPLLAWLLIQWVIPMETMEETQLAIGTLVMVGMPVANMVALFATEYGGDEKLAARTIFLTTVVAMISIPCVIWICL